MKAVFRLLLIVPATLALGSCQLIGPAINSALRLWPYRLVDNECAPSGKSIETRAGRIQNAPVYERRQAFPKLLSRENLANH